MGEHYTIVTKEHTPQLIAPLYADMLFIAKRWRGMSVFYNGATCGASAPDHAHLQAVPSKYLPLLGQKWMKKVIGGATVVDGSVGDGILFSDSYIVPLFVIKSADGQKMEHLLGRLLAALPVKDAADEPAVNIITAYKESDGWTTIVIPRGKHRPDCYFAEDGCRRVISPGALDMAGVIIAARREDLDSITADDAASMLREVALPVNLCREVVEKLSCGE
jgi:ATP adenylyltransferase/5',5'''-P-1,P-4-tetraphosphate phosphorylase II